MNFALRPDECPFSDAGYRELTFSRLWYSHGWAILFWLLLWVKFECEMALMPLKVESVMLTRAAWALPLRLGHASGCELHWISRHVGLAQLCMCLQKSASHITFFMHVFGDDRILGALAHWGVAHEFNLTCIHLVLNF